jgi:hypothetical protein
MGGKGKLTKDVFLIPNPHAAAPDIGAKALHAQKEKIEARPMPQDSDSDSDSESKKIKITIEPVEPQQVRDGAPASIKLNFDDKKACKAFLKHIIKESGLMEKDLKAFIHQEGDLVLNINAKLKIVEKKAGVKGATDQQQWIPASDKVKGVLDKLLGKDKDLSFTKGGVVHNISKEFELPKKEKKKKGPDKGASFEYF